MHLSVYPAHKATTTGGQLLCCTPLPPSGCMCGIGCIHARPARQAAFLCAKERGKEGRGNLITTLAQSQSVKRRKRACFHSRRRIHRGTPRFPTKEKNRTNWRFPLPFERRHGRHSLWSKLLSLAQWEAPTKSLLTGKRSRLDTEEKERDTHTRISVSRKNTPFPYFWFEGEGILLPEFRFFLQA